jgi:hypothetical protein
MLNWLLALAIMTAPDTVQRKPHRGIQEAGCPAAAGSAGARASL